MTARSRHPFAWVRRSEWLIRFLRLATTTDPPTSRGVVLIQIDGLPRPCLEQEMRHGRMPFLRWLMQRERYVLHSHYSGLPSNTPGVQGEMFYGVKTCVPAFSFVDHETGRVFRMYDAEAAKIVEDRLRALGSPLLEGGSAYSNIFTGGAAEPHYCAASAQWHRLLGWATQPWRPLLVLTCWIDVTIRSLGLMVVESVLGLIDCIRGVIQVGEWGHELQFILVRLGPVVLLRELVVWGASMDIARGLPVICLNLVGYDDHAHRRGPNSAFARWPLRGIDGAIRRLWVTSKHSLRRDYDVWIYSDHGEQQMVPYQDASGRTILEAIKQVCEDVLKLPSTLEAWPGNEYHPVPRRVSVTTSATKPPSGDVAPGSEPARVTVTSMGPVGHVYVPLPLEVHGIDELARRLIESAGVPVVVRAGPPGTATAWTSEGVFQLPQDTAKIVGADHPFLADVAEDLMAMCHHPDAGALMLLGWRPGLEPITFAVEHGAHAGCMPDETHGFALLPVDTRIPKRQRPTYLRPLDLRHAVLHALGRIEYDPREEVKTARPEAQLRVMTYNIHRCIGLDGKISPERIARVIARHDPDLVALQEVDVERGRTGGAHQVEMIAKTLQMSYEFSPTRLWTKGRYGNAVLSRYPLKVLHAERLAPLGRYLEPRGAMLMSVMLSDRPVYVLACHLSIWPYENLVQAVELMGKPWIGGLPKDAPLIVCGDFNAVPGSPTYREICRHLQDVQQMVKGVRPKLTWYSRYPVSRVDHIFVSQGIEVESVAVTRTSLDQVASDHLPLVSDLRLPLPAAPPPASHTDVICR